MSISCSFVRIAVGTVLVLTVAHTSFAQRVEPAGVSSLALASTTPSDESQIAPRRPNLPLGVAGGIVGGGLGFAAGMFAGASNWSHRNCSGEDCGLLQAIVGSAVGESVGLAVGAHYGSRGKGNLPIQLLTSTAIGMAGLYSAFYAEGAAPVILTATPLIQLMAVLAMEKD